MVSPDKPPLLHNDTQTTLRASYSVLISACSTGGHAQLGIVVSYRRCTCHRGWYPIAKQQDKQSLEPVRTRKYYKQPGQQAAVAAAAAIYGNNYGELFIANVDGD